MALSQPKFLDIPFANSSNQRTDNIPNNDTTGVGNASWEQGFPPETMIQIADGGVPPRGQDMNGILNQICKILQYVQTGTLFKYNSAFANSTNVNGYPKGALVLSTDKVTLWRNTVEGNKTNPDSGGAGWVNFLADLGLYLPLAGGTMTGRITSTNASVPIAFTNIGSGAYRDIQAVRSDTTKRIGVLRFNTTSTTNVVTIGASDAMDSAPSGVSVTRTLGDGNTAGTITITVATTPATSDSSKQVATTAYVKACVPQSVGSGVIPVYTNGDGKVIASSSTVGSATKPIYLNAGTFTSCSSSLTDYLPLAGGTMTGVINRSGVFVQNTVNTSQLNICGGTDTTHGARIDLFGEAHTQYPSQFFIHCRSVTNGWTISLNGKPDGSLTWGSNSILHAGNYGSYALPLSGGTLTGSVNFGANGNNFYAYANQINIDSAQSSQKEDWRFRGQKNSNQTTNTGELYQIGAYQLVNSQNYIAGIRVGNPRNGNIPAAATGVHNGNEWGTIGVKFWYANNYAYGWVSNTPPLSTSSPTYDANHVATVGNLKTALGDYLPLAGGTMTGQIKTSYTDALVKTNDTGHLTIVGGSAYANGASIRLTGKSESSNNGLFDVRAQDGTNYKDLIGKPDGTLTWGGNNVLTAANYSSYALPLAGGAMTGTEITRSVDNSFLRISGGTSYNAKGASLWLHGKDQADYLGQFRLRCSDGTNTKNLIGKPDGTLSWDGAVYLSSDGVYGVDLTGQTVNLNTCYSTISGAVKLFHCNTDGGADNISNYPEKKAFILVSYTPRRLSASDYVIHQHFYCIGAHYSRRCTNGTWTNWVLDIGAPSASLGDANTPVYLSNGVITSTGKSFANYLPLSGGTMTGNITKKYAALTKGTNPSSTTWHTDYITLDNGGTATANRLFELRSAVDSNGYNWVDIRAYDFTSGSTSENTLTVGRLLNGVKRTDINSAVIRIEDHKIMRNATNGWMRLTGGSTDNSGGGSLLLYGKEASSHEGQAILQAHNGTNYTNLTLNATSQAVLSTALKVAGGNNAISNTGLTVSGTNTNYSVKLQSTGFTKGTSNATTYRGTVEFYGNTMTKWQDRAGVLEFSVVSNKSQAQLVAYNVTAAENTGTSYIRAIVDASGNAYTETLTPAAGDNSTKIATTAWVTTAVTKGANMPPGTIVEYAGTSAPSGWLYCNGAAVSRTTYAALFSAIGTGYGTGNGSSTFNLPDFRNRVPQGGSSATDRGNIAAGLPNITGTVHGGKGTTASGAFTLGDGNVNSGEGNKTQGHWFSFDANDGATAWNSNSAGIYGNSTTVQPPAVKVMFIIKT